MEEGVTHAESLVMNGRTVMCIRKVEGDSEYGRSQGKVNGRVSTGKVLTKVHPERDGTLGLPQKDGGEADAIIGMVVVTRLRHGVLGISGNRSGTRRISTTVGNR